MSLGSTILEIVTILMAAAVIGIPIGIWWFKRKMKKVDKEIESSKEEIAKEKEAQGESNETI